MRYFLGTGGWTMVAALSLVAVSACGDDDGGTSAGGASSATMLATGTGAAMTVSNGGSGGTMSTGTSTNAGGMAGSGGNTGWWQPNLGTTWQWQLTELPIDQSFDVEAYDVDLIETSDAEVSQLKSAGRIVICYFSAGTWEEYRPDEGQFPNSVKGSALEPPFSDERWVDYRTSAVQDIMAARLDLAVGRGCDAVEPDNVDGYQNNNGLGLSANDQLTYNRWLADQAHARGLSVGLKNDLDQLDALVADFDWALNEECFEYDECDAYQANFVAAGKAVFHAEYRPPGQLSNVCSVTKPLGMSTILKDIDLGAAQYPCP